MEVVFCDADRLKMLRVLIRCEICYIKFELRNSESEDRSRLWAIRSGVEPTLASHVDSLAAVSVADLNALTEPMNWSCAIET